MTTNKLYEIRRFFNDPADRPDEILCLCADHHADLIKTTDRHVTEIENSETTRFSCVHC